MFSILQPSCSAIDGFLLRAKTEEFSYAEVGSSAGTIPDGYTVDRNSVRLGAGPETFRAAVAALGAWEMFNLQWLRVYPRGAVIEPGTTVAVVVRHFGFWSLNACRIVNVFDEQRRCGFAYGTLAQHAAKGEERFSIVWNESDDSVYYEILAFSRPRQWQARLAWPLSRMLQRKFARDSMAAMKHAASRQA
jgi:uncharacterized protein (UPF0548 family)